MAGLTKIVSCIALTSSCYTILTLICCQWRYMARLGGVEMGMGGVDTFQHHSLDFDRQFEMNPEKSWKHEPVAW